MRSVILAFALVAIVASQNDAKAQYRRGPVYRAMQYMPINPWTRSLIWNATRPQTVIIAPQIQQPTTAGSSSSPARPSIAIPERTVEIRVTLPVAGAHIKLNGTDMGKIDYFERKFNVPEPSDHLDSEYTVSATWTKDGKEITQERKVKVNKNGKAVANFFVDQPK